MASNVALPVKVEPVYERKPWGGQRLASTGFALPEGIVVGEALLTAAEAKVISEVATARTLGELARSAPEAWIGSRGLAATGGRAFFPLLVKLIDASADLSVQVHPDDEFAASANLGTGKTEAWHVLAAEPGSGLYLGLRPEANLDDFLRACRRADGAAADFLRRIPAETGMTIVVPAGTLHAIGAGVLIYEIQQPSNVTFRLDDWGRRDEAGQTRPLHHDSGFAVLDAESRPLPVAPIALATDPERTLLAATRYFALERILFAAGASAYLHAVDSPQVVTCLRGSGTLFTAHDAAPLAAGETIILPVDGPGTLTASAFAVVLRGWVPDLERDRAAPHPADGAKQETIEPCGKGRDT